MALCKESTSAADISLDDVSSPQLQDPEESARPLLHSAGGVHAEEEEEPTLILSHPAPEKENIENQTWRTHRLN